MNANPCEVITLVAGFPRSGSSLMMRLLQAAGVPPMCDNEASYEHDGAAQQAIDPAFMRTCHGRALKVLHPLEFTPPAGFPYRIVWMDRDPRQQARSELKFMRMVGGISLPQSPDTVERMAMGSVRDRVPTLALLRRLSPDVIEVRFEDLLERTHLVCSTLVQWLGSDADPTDMARVVVRRSTDCAPGVDIELANLRRDDERLKAVANG